MNSEFDAWVYAHRDLLWWMMQAERRLLFGSIVQMYEAGKLTHFDVQVRERKKTVELLDKTAEHDVK